MLYWLTSRDGHIDFKCEATDVPEAFELMARSIGYDSYESMLQLSKDKYFPASFRVMVLEDNRKHTYDEAADRRQAQQRRDNFFRSAFRHLLRQDD